MNKQLQEFARTTILNGLGQLTEFNHTLFKKMYSPDDPKASLEDVVSSMPVERLDWAMQQIDRTLILKQGAER